ncbi:MAG: hypothetical protein JW751_08800 [Polyangiaceae bacterium]|nr:hypothetical protein [Polyangiaceae bacterium]
MSGRQRSGPGERWRTDPGQAASSIHGNETPPIERLHRRLALMRQRQATRAWEYRQRRSAKGVWPRLCRLLADAEHAFIVDAHDLAQLLEQGSQLEAVGFELEPTKSIVFVAPERAHALPSARAIPLRLSPELLCAERLVLVRFPDGP